MAKKPPVKGRYRVAMKRRGAGAATVYTHARSPEQAERFAHFRKPGYRTTSVVSDPKRNPKAASMPGIVVSENVTRLEYQHLEDGEFYFHEFEGGVTMKALPDGSIIIYHPRKTLWKDIL